MKRGTDMKPSMRAVLILCFVFLGTTAFAGQFGAPEPLAKKDGRVSLGIGSFYSQNEWEPKEGINVQSTKAKSYQHYIQLSISAGTIETYFRIGGSNIKVENAYVTGGTANDPNIDGFKSEFKDGYNLFGTVGVKGVIDINENFAIGPFAQATLSDDYEDSTGGTVYGMPYTQNLKFKSPWEIDVGVAFQYRNRGFVAYAGPFLYWGDSRVEGSYTPHEGAVAIPSWDTKYEMKDIFGGMAGLRIPILPGLNIEIEGQYTNQWSAGANISYGF